MGFEIGLEGQGSPFVRKGAIPFKCPGSVLFGMGTQAFIVSFKAGFQVGAVSDVSPVNTIDTP
jgi:hypothetical protein